jgi:hypothetical protein
MKIQKRVPKESLWHRKPKKQILVTPAEFAIVKQYEVEPLGYECPFCHHQVKLVYHKSQPSEVRAAYCECGTWVGRKSHIPQNSNNWAAIVRIGQRTAVTDYDYEGN